MKVAIIGFATEGRSSYDYYVSRGHTVTVCDRNPEVVLPEGTSAQLGDGYLSGLDRFDVIVRSAGIPRDIILSQNPSVADKVTTVVDEFLRVCPTRNTIGITGTKGKGTTSTLTAKLLEAAGFKVFLGGNIGKSPLEFLPEITPDDYVVLELSSFQLSDLKHATHTSVCLMVVPEHLNWHRDLDDYILSKAHLFENQTNTDLAVYYAHSDDSRKIVGYSPALKIPYYADPGAYVKDGYVTIAGQQVCHINELKLLGQHNWQNVCAAVTVAWQCSQNIEAFRSVLTSFSGLPHRLEFVRELNDVRYYDDSFGTTPETAIVALQAFAEPKIIVLGGSDKGASYDELAKAVTNTNVRQAILIGDQAGRIKAALDTVGFTSINEDCQNMAEIVDAARAAAQRGDVVLLSTGCASFGMFENYKDRGDQFKQAVLALA